MRYSRSWGLVVLGLLMLLTGGPAWADTTCTLKWKPVTTYADGTASKGAVTYKVYLQGKQVAETTKPTITLEPCNPGEYYVTAYTKTAKESKASNKIRLKQIAAPKTLEEEK